MWSALSLPCNRRSASSRTSGAELGRPRRGASCAGCSTAGVIGEHLDEKHREEGRNHNGIPPHLTPLAIDRGRICCPPTLRRPRATIIARTDIAVGVSPSVTQLVAVELGAHERLGRVKLDVILERDTLCRQPRPWSTRGLGQDWPGVRSARPVRFTYASASSRRLPAFDLLESPFVERSHSLMSESTRTRARSSMIGIGSCLRCCSSRVAACPPVIFTASSPPEA